MVRWAVQALDRWVIRAATAHMPHSPAGEPRLQEAEALLRQRDFFNPSVDAPGDLVLTGDGSLRFPSPRPGPWPENNTVHGRLFRAGLEWQTKPGVLLLHGWNGERALRWLFPALAWQLNRQGVNAALIELPYHARRKPRGPGAPRNFISHDLSHTVAATQQALADVQALLAWLAAAGLPTLGILGFSLGGWLAGLLACHEPRLRFAALLTPVPRMDQAIAQLPFCEPIRRSLQGGVLRLDSLNLPSHALQIPPKNVLLIEGRYDVLVPADTIEELWRAWGHPAIWRLPHGHISVLLAVPVMHRIVRWLADQARTSR